MWRCTRPNHTGPFKHSNRIILIESSNRDSTDDRPNICLVNKCRISEVTGYVDWAITLRNSRGPRRNTSWARLEIVLDRHSRKRRLIQILGGTLFELPWATNKMFVLQSCTYSKENGAKQKAVHAEDYIISKNDVDTWFFRRKFLKLDNPTNKLTPLLFP